MIQANQVSRPDIALIVGGGPGISASCARLFAGEGMKVAVAARNPDKPVLETLEKQHGVRRYACDASDAADVERLFHEVGRDLGTPPLVVHNIDGRVAEFSPGHACHQSGEFLYRANVQMSFRCE